MNKRVVIALADHGWSQAKIARRFKVSRARINQIVRQIKRTRINPEGIRCEICGKPIKKKQYMQVEEAGVFLICDNCKEKI